MAWKLALHDGAGEHLRHRRILPPRRPNRNVFFHRGQHPGILGVGLVMLPQPALQNHFLEELKGKFSYTVSFEGSTWAELPFKFEAGTPHIAGAIGLGAAIDYVTGIGLERIAAHESELLDYATRRLREINSVRLIGTAPDKAAIVSFELDGIHPHDVGTILDREGVAVRTGHHCAQPVMDRFDVAATVRASFGLYNTRDEVDALVASLRRVQEIFGS